MQRRHQCAYPMHWLHILYCARASEPRVLLRVLFFSLFLLFLREENNLHAYIATMHMGSKAQQNGEAHKLTYIRVFWFSRARRMNAIALYCCWLTGWPTMMTMTTNIWLWIPSICVCRLCTIALLTRFQSPAAAKHETFNFCLFCSLPHLCEFRCML